MEQSYIIDYTNAVGATKLSLLQHRHNETRSTYRAQEVDLPTDITKTVDEQSVVVFVNDPVVRGSSLGRGKVTLKSSVEGSFQNGVGEDVADSIIITTVISVPVGMESAVVEAVNQHQALLGTEAVDGLDVRDLAINRSM